MFIKKDSKLRQTVKAHIPKDWLTDIRISYRILVESAKGIYQTGLINFAIIATMAAILVIFGGIFRTTLSISSMVGDMGKVLEISAYLKEGTNATVAENKIRALEHVKKTEFISKQASWADLKQQIDMPDVSNPLPDTLRIEIDNPKNIEKVMQALKSMDSIEDMSYAKDLVQKFQMVNKISHTVTLVVIIISCILTITVINNTIELVIQSRKEEIEIMRLMGVSNWYIKFPLVLQGATYGFCGALIAIWPVGKVNFYLRNLHDFLQTGYQPYMQPLTVFAVLFLGIAFSAGGSYLSIKKHLEA